MPPATISADPAHLLAFVEAANDLETSLTREAAALGAALDGVRRTCIDHCPPTPHLDADLRDLSADLERLLARYLTVALHFLAADCGGLWPLLCQPSDLVFRDLFGHGGPTGPPPPLATLILLSGDGPLSEDDLSGLGDAFSGLGHSAKGALDLFSPLWTGATSVLSSPYTAKLAGRLAGTPAGARVLATLGWASGSPLGKAAGAGLMALAIAEDVNRLERDGNPIDAFHRKGAGYVADVAGTAFDVTGAVCAAEPNPYTCGAAAAAGTVWVAAEAVHNHEDISHGFDLTRAAVVAEVTHLRKLASDALSEVGSAQRGLLDTIRRLDRSPGLVHIPSTVTHPIADAIEGTGRIVGNATSQTEHAASKGWNWLKDQVTMTSTD